MNRSLGSTLVLLLLSACGDGGTGPTSRLTPEETEAIALQLDHLGAGVLDGAALSLSPSAAGEGDPREGTREFERTRSCPAGGEILARGQIRYSWDPDTRTLALAMQATRSHRQCAIRPKEAVITLSGELATVANRKVVEGRPSGLQTTTHRGSLHWTRGERSGTCAVDLASVLDPDARTITLTGTLCDRAIERTRPIGARTG